MSPFSLNWTQLSTLFQTSAAASVRPAEVSLSKRSTPPQLWATLHLLTRADVERKDWEENVSLRGMKKNNNLCFGTFFGQSLPHRSLKLASELRETK